MRWTLDGAHWGVTRSTSGVGLRHLRLRQRIGLTVVEHDAFDPVSAYSSLN